MSEKTRQDLQSRKSRKNNNQIMTKKLLTTAFILLLGILPIMSQPYSPESDFTAIPINNNTAVRITGYTGTSTDVNIPSTFLGLPVVEIGGNAFEYRFGRRRLTSVTIPNSVTTIGGRAFHGNQLTSVVIPNSVTTIGGGAFGGNQLTSIVIPNSVTTIGGSAFNANRLTSITLPNNIRTIYAYTFNSNRLTEVVIPNSVREIQNSAFAQNPITSITIRANVRVHSWAFEGNFSSVYVNSNSVAGTYVVIGDAGRNAQWWFETEEVRRARQAQQRAEEEQKRQAQELENKFQSLVQSANNNFEQSRYEDARRYFESALALKPDRANIINREIGRVNSRIREEQRRLAEEERRREQELAEQERIRQEQELARQVRELNTSLKGVVINGVHWATRNADERRTFANAPEDAGVRLLIAWNRNSPMWKRSQRDRTGVRNPCPRGWRVPTQSELQSLVDAGSIAVTRNGVAGRLFGTYPNQIFLPNRPMGSGRVEGLYWSSTQSTTVSAYSLEFNPHTVKVIDTRWNFQPALDFKSFRCVADN